MIVVKTSLDQEKKYQFNEEGLKELKWKILESLNLQISVDEN